MRQAGKQYLAKVNQWTDFFSRATMQFFSSRIESEVYLTNNDKDSAFLVTSEQFDDESPRLFTVRYMYRMDDGSYHVETLEGFQNHPTKQSAVNRIADFMDAMTEGMTHDDLLERC